MGQSDLQFVLKELVKHEQNLIKEVKAKKENGAESDKTRSRQPEFCRRMCKVVTKNFDEVIKTRACWILIALLEDPNTSHLLDSVVKGDGLKKVKNLIEEQKKDKERDGKVDRGLQMLKDLMDKEGKSGKTKGKAEKRS